MRRDPDKTRHGQCTSSHRRRTGGGMTDETLNHEQYKKVKRQRVEQAASDYPTVRRLAANHGFTLRQCHREHYRLEFKGKGHPDYMAWNLYPGKCRIWVVPGTACFLAVPTPWTLSDVVEAAIAQLPNEHRRPRTGRTTVHNGTGQNNGAVGICQRDYGQYRRDADRGSIRGVAQNG